MFMRILVIGDIVGEAGRNAVARYLPPLKREKGIDLVVANAENAAAGFGITPKIAEELFQIGIDVLTGGNHLWDKKEIIDYLPDEPRLLRPANYPPEVPGAGSLILNKGGEKVGVLHLMGRTFMPAVDCPFRVGLQQAEKMSAETRTIIVDFHGEATSEKMAIGWHLDGRVTAVVGTHTHVQTADDRILPGGTAYLTDIGMTGPMNSVIGVKKELAISRFLTQMPRRFETASGPAQFCAVAIETGADGRAEAIERIYLKEEVS
jgi:metallophosphoesterase (TIGR00282 family)